MTNESGLAGFYRAEKLRDGSGAMVKPLLEDEDDIRVK